MATTFDAAATPTFSAANVASLTSPSWTLTGSNLYVHAGVLSGANTPVDPSAVKVGGSGGTAMTQKGATQNVGANVKVSAWGLANAPAGSTTSYVSWASNQDETALVAASYAGVDTSTPNRTVATATGSNATPSVAATSVSGDLVVDVAGFLDGNGAALTLTVGASQTSHGEVEGANLTFEGLGTSHEAATTTSTTMSWTISGTPQQGWATIAYALIPSTGGGGVITTKTMSDTTIVSDAAVNWNRRARRSDEAIAITDDPNRIIQMQLDDSIVAVIDEGIDVTRRVRVAQDTLTLGDSTIQWRRLRRTLDDSIVLLDQFTKALAGSGTIYTKVMSEALDLTDGVIRYLRYRRTTDDTLTLIDAFSKLLSGAGLTYARIMSDSVVLADDAGNRWKFARSVASDALVLADEIVRGASRGRVSSDTIAITDALTKWTLRLRALGDDVEFSDGTVKVRQSVRTLIDQVDITDEAIRSLFFDQLQPTNFRFSVGSDPFRFGVGALPFN